MQAYALGCMFMRDLEQDAITAYEAAVERAELLRARWVNEGKPVLTEGGATGRALVAHPLIRMIQEAEVIADKLRQPVLKKHRGPQPAAVMHPPASARLRKVS